VTGLSCVSITACHAALDVLERLSYSREELAGRLTSLRSNSQARAVAVLSTCQRTEVYATWPGQPDDPALLAALALDRGVPGRVLRPVARTYRGGDAARHLLRVASGLESFVLGETEIAGQVRAAADISRAAGGRDVELERLMDAAISASRKRQRQTSILAATRSIAGVAVDAVTRSNGGTLAGQRLLVVGAGQVASVVVARAVEQRAFVTYVIAPLGVRAGSPPPAPRWSTWPASPGAWRRATSRSWRPPPRTRSSMLTSCGRPAPPAPVR
jgi:glutamyl-tRNA reductase